MKKYIGDRKLYRHFLILALPMIIQNMVTTFVNMLDNIMIGRVGTLQMSGVSIVNEFFFIFFITIFGGVSGAGIFGAQYFGKKDPEGQKYTVRFRVLLTFVIALITVLLFTFYDEQLIGIFLSKTNTAEMNAETMLYAKKYMSVMRIGLIPFAIGQAYASVVKECGETRIPMMASISAIGINLVLNYGLIFGNLGMPKLGVTGAAIATVAAKFAEAAVIIIWAHTRPEKNPYITGLYRSLYIPGDLTKQMVLKGTPLLMNEFLWSLGMSLIAQSYSVRGLDVIAARNIAYTLSDLFSVVYVQLGASIGIILGNLLGADACDEAEDTSRKLLFFAIVAGLFMGLLMIPCGILFPNIYKVSPEIRSLASFLLLVQGFAMPIWSYTNGVYFILRCGGKTGITFLFDFGFNWVVMIPLAFILCRFSTLPVRTIMILVTGSEIFKVFVGHFLYRSRIWIQRIV